MMKFGKILFISFCSLCTFSCDSEDENHTGSVSTEDKEVEDRKAARVFELESIVIPVVDFENTSVEEAIDFLRIRARELDREVEPSYKGVSFIIRKTRSNVEYENTENTEDLLSSDVNSTNAITLKAENIKLVDALAEIATQTELDIYFIGGGCTLVPKGTKIDSAAEAWTVIQAE
ncbi:hypothetical protein [Persicirhabdus sediminis]|uniref:Uncharacterized protein n=1 Tax=Persicirhabdus sediminis TaxID=454144 RepID=A0A8J7MGA4_9BACT|nr:hypothetical protein [Persicirhabdus sediminis]MBK1791269.1 hypothetical protein [Persicirhabdus sediminis]